ncbi:hypothetical protein [Actinoplanes regularis]|uniref:Uncharacterized protein n=1 Tax=Actinoplanes regularis TaxID=52697 RepID=A0A239FS34_9ACTN|nr:hypothetical protein [Actinoplanes regularis]GIE90163.1 hypothetical protein Are01nite_66430 [Actinoplanes regularis]SNS59595.1 hypothetical protein SAMN06264365_11923 [Actinoplanes regularis]
MDEDDRDLSARLAVLDGAIAELVHNGAVAGWLAVQAAPFRNLFFVKQIGCWLLFTWADGTIEIEEDYPPFALLRQILEGTFRSDDDGPDYEVRWVPDDRRQELWQRYGVHEAPGYYMGLAAKQRRDRP